MSSSKEINPNYCWQIAENTANESPSLSSIHIRPFSASVCSRSSRRSTPTKTTKISTMGSPRPNRQSIGNVAALFASAARAAIGSATGTDSGLIR